MVEVDASTYQLGLDGRHQMMNAVLAKNICLKWIESICRDKAIVIDSKSVEESIVSGLLDTRWPGRSQVYTSEKFSNLEWALDGAHTKESMKACINWFQSLTKPKQ